MAFACEKLAAPMISSNNQAGKDHSNLMRALDTKQRKTIALFRDDDLVTSKQIGDLFRFYPRTNAALCKQWVEDGFLKISDSGFKSRKYS